jgi:hypothetical protein
MRVMWTGVGAQLAPDVPLSAICWSVLEPVSLRSLAAYLYMFPFCMFSTAERMFFLQVKLILNCVQVRDSVLEAAGPDPHIGRLIHI